MNPKSTPEHASTSPLPAPALRADQRRRLIVGGMVAAVSAPGLLGTAAAQARGRPIRIGFVSPRTGPLAPFGEGDSFVVAEMRQRLAGGITVNGVLHPVEILDKDSQSNGNRASEIAAALIKSDKVDLMLAASTSETVNPVADQCEINRVPCLTADNPWQPYFFGRGGKPDKGFDWTYHFFWGLEDIIKVFTTMWNSVPTNKVVACLWPNDAEGRAFSDPKIGFPAAMQAQGFTVVDRGRFQPAQNDFSAQISAFKAAGTEIVTGALTPPAFATFWTQAAQQGFKPKVATIAKALLFPAAVGSLGDRAVGLTTEVWWSPGSPFKSGLTGQTAAQYCAAFEAATGKPWTQPLGFRHALFEVAVDVLKRTRDIDSPAAVRDALAATDYASIVGQIKWTGQPVKNVCKTPLVGGQWTAGTKFKHDLLIVSNDSARNVPVQRAMQPLPL